MDANARPFQPPLQLTCLGSEQTGSLDTLGQREFDILAHLCHQRRTLPVYREGLWCCYECGFYSADIDEVGRHLLGDHEALPPDAEDEEITH